MTSEPIVRYDATNGVATITLNRPDSLNSMTDELMLGLHQSIDRVIDDQSVRVVVLTGEGRGFCSGADLSGVGDPEDGSVTDPVDPTAGMTSIFNPAIAALAECPVPTIARINGAAAGGGMGLALGCDIAIAARSAFFVCTFGPNLGIVPDLGTTWHLPRSVGAARARGIAMLGGRITAEQAAEWGLIWSVVDDDKLDDAVTEAADRLRSTSPNAMTRIRSTLAAAPHNTLREQLDLERDHQSVLIPLNMVRAAAAFTAKETPTFDGERGPR